jgi:hypothetical protein
MVTRVRDDVWPCSWDDVFIDYAAWERAGNPGGYVWGTNWSLAYPGLEIIEPSAKAADWERRLGAPMYEVALKTERFWLTLIFHSLRTEQVDDDVELISRVIIPLKNE